MKHFPYWKLTIVNLYGNHRASRTNSSHSQSLQHQDQVEDQGMVGVIKYVKDLIITMILWNNKENVQIGNSLKMIILQACVVIINWTLQVILIPQDQKK